jgi:acetyl-CoA carboxylase biotin carboxyl carrier protein
MKIQEIQDLIKLVSRSGVTEVEIEQKDFKLSIKSEGKKKSSKFGESEATVIQATLPIGMPQMPGLMPVQAISAAVPAPGAAAPVTETPANKEEDSKYITIKSPMIGTFYRSSSPDTDSYINVGDSIKPGKVICIVEAMKLFNEIESEVAGSIVKVLVDDATPVEYDQPLFLVDPS